MRKVRTTSVACAFIVIAGVLSAPALRAKPITYDLLEDKTTLKQGAGADVAQNNCGACHSYDYIATQPRGASFKAPFWKAEVDKMIKVYGAPIDAGDVGKIVDYLTANY